MSNEKDSGGLGFLLFIAAMILPIYAAYKDYQLGETVLAILDIVLGIPVGIIRGIMYLM